MSGALTQPVNYTTEGTPTRYMPAGSMWSATGSANTALTATIAAPATTYKRHIFRFFPTWIGGQSPSSTITVTTGGRTIFKGFIASLSNERPEWFFMGDPGANIVLTATAAGGGYSTVFNVSESTFDYDEVTFT